MTELRVAWPGGYNRIGNYLGFARHNDKLREASVKAGLVLDDDAPVAVAVGSPRWWIHTEGKQHVLSCAWECHDLPEVTAKGAELADAYVVTSPFLMPVFKKQFPDKPVRCVPLGVDAEHFPYIKRRDPVRCGEKTFVFGWVGAANKRKGHELALIAWQKFRMMRAALNMPDAPAPVLYLKLNPVGEGKVERGPKGVILDSRNLSRDELCAVYHSFNAFVFPSYGEGFGFTVGEAAATGLPVLYTPKTALGDLLDSSCGYPLEWHWTKQVQDEAEVQMPQADTNHLAKMMVEVMLRYPRALKRGKVAAARIREEYTWKIAGKRFVKALQEIVPSLARRRRSSPSGG